MSLEIICVTLKVEHYRHKLLAASSHYGQSIRPDIVLHIPSTVYMVHWNFFTCSLVQDQFSPPCHSLPQMSSLTNFAHISGVLPENSQQNSCSHPIPTPHACAEPIFIIPWLLPEGWCKVRAWENGLLETKRSRANDFDPYTPKARQL